MFIFYIIYLYKMDSQTLISVISSLLILSILAGVGAYFFIYKQEEEVVPEPTTPEPTTPEPTTPRPTTTMPPAPTAPTPRPTTAAPYEVGQAIKCVSNDVGGGNNAIYRYDGNNTLRMYPDAKIAKDWDSNFLDSKNVDCTDLKMGTNMNAKLEVGVEPDPDYVGLKQNVDTNYSNVPSVCYSAAGGECSNLRIDDCEAEMKSFAKYGKKGTAGDFVIRQSVDNKATLVWYTGTQYLNADAKLILGEDGVLRVISKGTNYWRSSNNESTDGPFSARLAKVDGKCRLSIYDTNDVNLWSTS
jgi:hypothetical protein